MFRQDLTFHLKFLDNFLLSHLSCMEQHMYLQDKWQSRKVALFIDPGYNDLRSTIFIW